MDKPTEVQVKEFWEWCELTVVPLDLGHIWWVDKDKNRVHPAYEGNPPIDLNNLGRYAVPLLLEKHTIIETYSFKQENGLYYSETTIWDKDEGQLKGKLISKAFTQDFNLEKATTLALFWVLYKVMKNK